MTKTQTLVKLVSIVEVGREEEKQQWVLMANDLGVKGIDLHRFVFKKLPDSTDEEKKKFEALATKVRKDDR